MQQKAAFLFLSSLSFLLLPGDSLKIVFWGAEKRKGRKIPKQHQTPQKPMRTTSMLLMLSTLLSIFLANSVAESVSNNPKIAQQEQKLCEIDNSFSWCK